MQRSIWIVFLPLFLVLFAGVSWVSCCHLDIGNSVQSRFGSVLKSEMAAKNMTRGMRRLSKHRVAEDCEGEDRVERSNYVNSKRWRTMFGPHIAEGSTRCQNADAFEHSDNQFTVAEDLENSLQSNSLIALDPVIASNTIQTKGKRYLQEDDTEHYDDQEMGSRIRSERWRQVFQPMIVAKDQVAQETLQMSIDQNFAAYVDRETDCQIRSRRSKRRKQVGIDGLFRNFEILKKPGLNKCLRSGSCNVFRSKTCRQKMRRDRLNDNIKRSHQTLS